MNVLPWMLINETVTTVVHITAYALVASLIIVGIVQWRKRGES